MAFDSLLAFYTRLTEGIAPGSNNLVRATALQSQAVGAVEAPGFEMSRCGRRFEVGFLSTVTGIAPVQALPTTAAQWLLYNPSTTKSVSIDELGVVLVSGTAGAGVVLLAGKVGPGTLPSSLPTTSATGIKTAPANDGTTTPSRVSQLVIASGQTLAAAPTNGWREVAKSDSANTAILSVAAINPEINGEMVIRPLCGLALVVTSPAGTSPLYVPHVVYGEYQVDIE